MLKLLLWTLTVPALLSACGGEDGQRPAYSQFESVGQKSWKPSEMMVFEPWPADSADASRNTYRLRMVMRCSERKLTGSFPMVVLIDDENGTIASDTITVDPAKAAKGHYGVRELSLTLMPEVRLTDGFAVSLYPLGELASDHGLLNIGLVLDPVIKRSSNKK